MGGLLLALYAWLHNFPLSVTEKTRNRLNLGGSLVIFTFASTTVGCVKNTLGKNEKQV